MDEFLEYVLRRLAEFPDEVIITRADLGRKVSFQVRMRQSDIGRVIGRHGQTIKAIRNLVNASAQRHGQRAIVQIVEEVRRPA